jgi:hypothetical protein
MKFRKIHLDYHNQTEIMIILLFLDRIILKATTNI